MQTAFQKAIELILSCDPELINILGTTARVCLISSLLSVAIGVPLGIIYGSVKFPGRGAVIVVNRTLMSIPPVVCGLIFYLLFSGVGPFRGMHLLFTVEIMIIAQVALIAPLAAATMETFVSGISKEIITTAKGLGLKRGRTFLLIMNESVYQIFSTYLLTFARAIAEVGAVSMVGGAIAWKTNVMTTAIMQYTNKGDFSMGIALGVILFSLSLILNILLSVIQRRFRVDRS